MKQKIKIALQMDPLEKLNLKGDTTFILGHEALKRGFEVYYYSASDLTYKNGFVYANTKILDLAFRNGNERFFYGKNNFIYPIDEIDVIAQESNYDYEKINAVISTLQGENLLSVDINELRMSIISDAWIKDVEIKKSFPSKPLETS